ncbi:hypothetical protein AGATL06_29820 [Agathobaculum sp. TL06]
MAKMIFVVRNNTIDDSAYENNSSKMTDISTHWAKGYIKFCESQGIIAGYGDNTFRPDATVTGVEAAKMLLVLAGYDADKAGLVGSNWSTNTLRYAGAAGILDDVNAGLESGLPRQYAAQMIYNALETNRVKWSNDSGSFDDILNGGVKETVGKAYMGLCYDYGTLVSISKDSLSIVLNDSYSSDNYHGWRTNNNSTSWVGGDVTFTKVSTDYSNLMGQTVKVMFKDGKTNDVLGVYPTSDNTTYSTVMNAVEADGAKIKFGGKSYSLENSGVTVYVNGEVVNDGANPSVVTLKKAGDFDNDFTNSTTGTTLLTSSTDYVGSAQVGSKSFDARPLNRISADEVIFVDSNDNGKIDTAILTTVDVAKATYVSSDEIVAGGTTYKYEDEQIADDIEKNDYVAIREDLYNDCKSITRTEKLTGVKVTGTKDTPNQYLIDGSWYVEGANADMNSAKSGDTVDSYVVNGVVYYAKRASGENSTLSDVAIVMAVGTDIQGDKVKILKLDGTTSTEIVDIDNDPGAGYVAKGDLQEGAAYEYSVKGGEYRFKQLDQTTDYFGDYTAKMKDNSAPATATDGMAITKSTTLTEYATAGSDKYIGGVKVDDSAKIVLIDKYATNSADYKVITGKQFKSLATVASAAVSPNPETGSALQAGGIAAFISKVNGVNRVTYGVVAVDGIADTFVTNDNYGYVVENSYKSDDGYMVYTIWNGTENVKVQEKSNTKRSKGDVLGYSSITTEDGLADGVVGTIEDVDDNFGLVDNGIVYGVSDDQTTISLDGSNTNDITKDTIVLYVDTDDHKGYENGEIQEADDFGSGKIPNVMYKLDGAAADSDVELLVVDVKNNLHGAFSYTFGTGASLADINTALSKSDVNVILNGEIPAGTLTVGSGNTLTLANGAEVSSNVTISGTGTIEVTGIVELTGGKLDIPDAITMKAGAGFDVAKTATLDWEDPKFEALQGANAAFSVRCVNGDTDNLEIVIKESVTLQSGKAGSSDLGSLTIPAGVTVTVPSGSTLQLGGTVTVNGSIDVQSGGSIFFTDDGKITFAAGSDLDIDGGATKVVVNGTQVKVVSGTNSADIISAIGGATITAGDSFYETSDSGSTWTAVSTAS